MSATLARDQDALVLLGSSHRSVGDVRATLRDGEALLEYFVTPAELLIFVLRRDTLMVVTSDVRADELLSRVRLARDLLASTHSNGEERPVLEQLHEILLAPVIATGGLRDVQHLIVARHSMLSYLPFAALLNANTRRFLVEDVSLLYAPSAAALHALRTPALRSAPLRTARAVALAPFPDRLPATRFEATTFVRTVPQARMLVGVSASEMMAREALQSGAVVHIASHAVMNSRNPLFSRVELATTLPNDGDDNGRLEVHELLGLKVASPLVFLSGCETGVGDSWSTAFQPGEDYTTLAQALLFSGAKNVVATLWPIDDEGGADLAGRFYAAAVQQRSVAEAMAAAQRSMMHSLKHSAPYFWAAFELHGRGGVEDFAQFAH